MWWTFGLRIPQSVSRRLSGPIMVGGYLGAVMLLSLMVWATGYHEALRQAAARGEADLALASDRLVNQLGLYREIAVLLAPHPALAALHDPATQTNALGQTNVRAAADALLLSTVDKTSARTAYYSDAAGRVLAAAPDTGAPDQADGAPLARALQGALGAGQSGAGVDRRYRYATPAFGPDGRVRGVLTVEIDVALIED
ncbi:MAG: hypothetical protein ACPGVS_03195, partial [Primorskyibacter sp.]